jgi:general secretion pathway protein C
MEMLFKRYFWTLPLVMITACAILAALGVNHVVEAKYLLDADAPRAAHHAVRPVKPQAQKPPPSKDAQEVINRNIFCSTCEPAKPSDAPAAVPTPVDDNHPPVTQLPLALLVTMVAEDPHLSTATIMNTSTQRSGIFAVDDWIPAAGQVRKIRFKSIVFFNKSMNRLERLELLGSSGQPVASATPAAPPPPPPAVAANPNEPPNPDDALLAAVDKGVKKLDENRFDIDRSLVDKILADPTVAARSARIVPSIKDGKPNGFKMYAIRPNSLFAKIGLQNGDTISSINGFDMSSPDKALEVYTKVRSASSLSVSVLRRGQPMNLDYSIK